MFLDYINKKIFDEYFQAKFKKKFEKFKIYDIKKILSEKVDDTYFKECENFLNRIEDYEKKNIFIRFYSVIEYPYGPNYECSKIYCMAYVLGDTNCKILKVNKSREPFWINKSELSKAMYVYTQVINDELNDIDLVNNPLFVEKDYVRLIYSNLPIDKQEDYKEHIKNIYEQKQKNALNSLSVICDDLIGKLN